MVILLVVSVQSLFHLVVSLYKSLVDNCCSFLFFKSLLFAVCVSCGVFDSFFRFFFFLCVFVSNFVAFKQVYCDFLLFSPHFAFNVLFCESLLDLASWQELDDFFIQFAIVLLDHLMEFDVSWPNEPLVELDGGSTQLQEV